MHQFNQLMRREYCWRVLGYWFLTLNYNAFLCSEKTMINVLRKEVSIPLFSYWLRNKIALVYNDQESSFTVLTSICEQVLTVEK